LAIWRIFRRSPLSEENYPNRNPAWKQALLVIDFQLNTRKDSSTSLSAKTTENQRFALVFFYPYANEACFSERNGHKKHRTPKADWFSCVFGTVPSSRDLLSEAKKIPATVATGTSLVNRSAP
jgi:hypothetical protein